MIREFLVALAVSVSPVAEVPASTEYVAARERMVASVRNMAASAGLPDRRRLSPAVLDALRQVPRHAFVPAPLRPFAYANRPLPIGNGQTISQPYIVALMTDLLEPGPDDVVLEVGTGSGYQAAVLAELVKQVYTIEIVEPLAQQASRRLAELGYANVTVHHGDGYAGWPEYAPFDAIMVTAGAERVPAPLVAQLKPGGRMAIPVGEHGRQELLLIEKRLDGTLRRRSVLPVTFVPFTRDVRR